VRPGSSAVCSDGGEASSVDVGAGATGATTTGTTTVTTPQRTPNAVSIIVLNGGAKSGAAADVGGFGVPTLDARGDLVGVCDRRLDRDSGVRWASHADLRYALWLLDLLDGSDDLLLELGVTPSVP